MSSQQTESAATVDVFEFPKKEALGEHYELMLLVSGNASDEDAAKTFSEVKELIASFSGTVTTEEVIGRKSLAYSVDKVRTGNYFVAEFDMTDKALLAQLQEKLRIRKDVTRYIIVKKRLPSETEMKKRAEFQEKREEYRKKKMIENATKPAAEEVVEAKPAKGKPKAEAKDIDTLINDENVAV